MIYLMIYDDIFLNFLEEILLKRFVNTKFKLIFAEEFSDH